MVVGNSCERANERTFKGELMMVYNLVTENTTGSSGGDVVLLAR